MNNFDPTYQNQDNNHGNNNNNDNRKNNNGYKRNNNNHNDRQYNNHNNRNNNNKNNGNYSGNNNKNNNDNNNTPQCNTIDENKTLYESPGEHTINYDSNSMSYKGHVNGKSCNIIFDTGSEITLMTKRYFDSLNLNHMIENSRCQRIRAVDNNTIIVFGKITVPITIEKIEITVTSQIISDIPIPILKTLTIKVL